MGTSEPHAPRVPRLNLRDRALEPDHGAPPDISLQQLQRPEQHRPDVPYPSPTPFREFRLGLNRPLKHKTKNSRLRKSSSEEEETRSLRNQLPPSFPQNLMTSTTLPG